MRVKCAQLQELKRWVKLHKLEMKPTINIFLYLMYLMTYPDTFICKQHAVRPFKQGSLGENYTGENYTVENLVIWLRPVLTYSKFHWITAVLSEELTSTKTLKKN